jgi:hypothetical protein
MLEEIEKKVKKGVKKEKNGFKAPVHPLLGMMYKNLFSTTVVIPLEPPGDNQRFTFIRGEKKVQNAS